MPKMTKERKEAALKYAKKHAARKKFEAAKGAKKKADKEMSWVSILKASVGKIQRPKMKKMKAKAFESAATKGTKEALRKAKVKIKTDAEREAEKRKKKKY